MKKFTQVALAAGLAVALSSSAFAGGYSRAEAAAMPAHHCGVHGLGVSLFSTIGGGSNQGFLDLGHDVNVGVDYIMHQWEMGMSVGGTHTAAKDGVVSTSNVTTSAYAGYRMALMHCLFGSVGGEFAWNHVSAKPVAGAPNVTQVFRYTDTYNMGAYLGLSYEPTEHFALFTRVDAVDYTYSRNSNGTSTPVATQPGGTWNFFNAGVVGMSYYFGDVV